LDRALSLGFAPLILLRRSLGLPSPAAR
jgi:hypothetical protein